MRSTLGIVVALLVWVGGALAADTVKTVTVTGEGINADMALKDALRNALEAGAGVMLSNKSRTENFELVRDTIFTRSDGLVRSHEILEAGEGAGRIFYCKIRAVVSPDAIAREWGEVQDLLHQRGNPRITVFVAETIDGEPSTSSILESMIEKRLIKVGFDVYARSQLDAIKAKEVDDAIRRNDPSKVQALAKRFSTQIFITGFANANQSELKLMHGAPFAFYNCDVQIKTYYTDTAKLLDSSSNPATRGAARGEHGFSPQAAKKAFANAAPKLIDDMYAMVMKNWAYEISFGGQIDLEISGMPNIGVSLRMKKALMKIPGIETVNVERGEGGLAYYRIRATITGEDLGMHFVDGDWAKKLELVDLSLNRVQAKWIGG